MKVKAIKTKIFDVRDNIDDLIVEIIEKLKIENGLQKKSVIGISSKVISLCQHSSILNEKEIINIIKVKDIGKDELIKKEADRYIGAKNHYNVQLTIKNGVLIPNAGIDESNAVDEQGDDCYILWPKNIFETCEYIWRKLSEFFQVEEFGVMLLDSHSTPSRYGVIGLCLGFYGFEALEDCIGRSDLFGKVLKTTKRNQADALAAAAVFEMGESDECSPVVLISELNSMKFAPTSSADIENWFVPIEEDIYGIK